MGRKILALAMGWLLGVSVLAGSVQAADSAAGGAVGDPNSTPGELSYFLYLRTKADDANSTVVASYSNFGAIINFLARVLTIAAGVLFFFLILTSGYKLVMSGDKEGALREVRKRLTIGVVGLVVVMAAYWVSQLLLNITGISETYKTEAEMKKTK